MPFLGNVAVWLWFCACVIASCAPRWTLFHLISPISWANIGCGSCQRHASPHDQTGLKDSENEKHITSASVSAIAIAIAAPAVAQDEAGQSGQTARTGGVPTIVVTAQKRSEDLQDVPVSVQALGQEGLEQLNIDTFEDYLEQLPTVTAGGSGPGQSTIYIRGLASTTPNLTTAGVAGLAPNVALYLDEQPLAQPGRNLDVYAADLERIEVLSGPQGTLFGASSQAGVVRLITNKPSLAEFDASASAGVSFTKGGRRATRPRPCSTCR